MAVKKACKICRALYEGSQCPQCGSQEYIEDWKGKVMIFNPDSSEVAKNMKITKKGTFAIKTR